MLLCQCWVCFTSSCPQTCFPHWLERWWCVDAVQTDAGCTQWNKIWTLLFSSCIVSVVVLMLSSSDDDTVLNLSLHCPAVSPSWLVLITVNLTHLTVTPVWPQLCATWKVFSQISVCLSTLHVSEGTCESREHEQVQNSQTANQCWMRHVLPCGLYTSV